MPEAEEKTHANPRRTRRPPLRLLLRSRAALRRARPRQPDRRAHRLQRRLRDARGHRLLHHRRHLPPHRRPHLGTFGELSGAHRQERPDCRRRLASLRAGAKSWSDYPAGVLWALREHGVPIENGFSLTIAGDVPLNAGLSSSASVEVATAFAVLGATSFDLPLKKIALLCQRAENAFVGANSASWTSSSVAAASRTMPS